MAVAATITCFPVPRSPAGAGSGNGPEALCSKPEGYPFKGKSAALILSCAVSPGLQFLAGVPLGRMLFENESLTKLLVPFPAQRPSEARSSSPRVPATVSGGGLGAGAPINPVRQLHGFISVGLRNFQEIGQKNRNEGGCGRRSQSKPRIAAPAAKQRALRDRRLMALCATHSLPCPTRTCRALLRQ